MDVDVPLLVDLHFDDRCDEAAKGTLCGDATSAPQPKRATPFSLVCGQLNSGAQTRALSQIIVAKGHRVASALSREFINETLNCKHVVIGPDTAPESGRYSGRFGAHKFDLKVGNVIRDI